MSDEFPAELKKRLAVGLKKDLYFTLTLWDAEYATDFVLRESGYAELVAALKEARHYANLYGDDDEAAQVAIMDVTNAALKLAGESA
jgi:hypothetical protein